MAADDVDKQEATEPLEGEVLNSETGAEESNVESEVKIDEAAIELAAKIETAVALALVEQQDSVLRAQAEVQNMRRRCEADVEKAHKFALEKFSIELLSVMDNMERALQAVPDQQADGVKGLCEGVELTMKELLDIFTKFNIEQIDPAGEPFDPQLHQAMSMVENNDVEPNTVIAVMQKGYSLSGRVVRPAMVMVSKS